MTKQDEQNAKVKINPIPKYIYINMNSKLQQ